MWSGSGEGPHLGATFLLFPHMVERKSISLKSAFIRAIIPFLRSPLSRPSYPHTFHLQLSSRWNEGFNTRLGGEHKHAVCSRSFSSFAKNEASSRQPKPCIPIDLSTSTSSEYGTRYSTKHFIRNVLFYPSKNLVELGTIMAPHGSNLLKIQTLSSFRWAM